MFTMVIPYCWMLFVSMMLTTMISSTNMSITNTTTQFTGVIPTNNTTEGIPMLLNSTNLTQLQNRYGNNEDSTFDVTNIRFHYDNSNTLWENQVERIIARGMLQFALQINNEVFAKESRNLADDNNVVFSPASLYVALAMVMLGSAGNTYKEIANVLGVVSDIDLSTNSHELHYHFGRLIKKVGVYHGYDAHSVYAAMAGAMFIQNSFPVKEEFVRLSEDIYASEVFSLDFISHGNEAKEIINNWVQNRTYGHIKNILEYPPPPSTKIIIVSTLYFNGPWEYPFAPEQTSWKPFYVSGNHHENSSQVVLVNTMINGADFPYYDDPVLGCQLVGLPYKDNSSVMYLVLPYETGYKGLRNLQQRLTVQYLQYLADSASERTVIITVPRMKLESTLNLKDVLKSLGIQSLFDPFQADLSEISDHRNSNSHAYSSNLREGNKYENYNNNFTNSNINNTEELQTVKIKDIDSKGPVLAQNSESIRVQGVDSNAHTNADLYADDVIHKVMVDVTETGTIASAASIISVTRDGSHKTVRFDRPFLFFIRHQGTGIVLFWGTVIRPTPYQQS